MYHFGILFYAKPLGGHPLRSVILGSKDLQDFREGGWRVGGVGRGGGGGVGGSAGGGKGEGGEAGAGGREGG